MNANLSAVLYLVAGVLFILSLRGLSSPASSRRGNLLGMAGMAIAVGTTLANHPPADFVAWLLVILGVGIGGSIGALIARRVPMTTPAWQTLASHKTPQSSWPWPIPRSRSPLPWRTRPSAGSA